MKYGKCGELKRGNSMSASEVVEPAEEERVCICVLSSMAIGSSLRFCGQVIIARIRTAHTVSSTGLRLTRPVNQGHGMGTPEKKLFETRT